MSAATIRERLYDYIRVADDKKLKAIYTMLEDTITEDLEWWNNTAFVTALEKDQKAWASGKEKGYSMTEIRKEIAKRKKKIAAK